MGSTFPYTGTGLIKVDPDGNLVINEPSTGVAIAKYDRVKQTWKMAAANGLAFTGPVPWYDLVADAKCDTQAATDVACTSGSAAISSASGLFTQADVGKLFDLYGGTSPGITGTQTGTIASVQSATAATLSVNANANATNATLWWGTDDTAAVQTWLNRGATGRLRVSGKGICMITNTVTTLSLPQIEGGGASFFISSRAGTAQGIDIGAAKAHAYLSNFSVNCALGYTGRAIQGVGSNEAGSLLLLRDINIFSPNDGADYLCFLQAMVATIEHCHFNANNKLSNKALAHTAVISNSMLVDSTMIGRVYVNAQSYGIVNCGTGPIRAANNSAADGSGSAQQTNTLNLSGANYVYSSSSGGTDFPCIASVVASTSGEGAAGGCLPNLSIHGGYLVMGAGAQATQYAIEGSMTAAQGAVGVVCDGTGFVQSASSPATTMYLGHNVAGAAPWRFRSCAANILSTCTTFKTLLVVAGNADAVIDDFMPTGQTTVLQHPLLSAVTPSAQNLPASGTATRNAFATAFEIWITQVVAITKVEASVDNVTFVTLWTGTGATTEPFPPFRWPPGVWMRFTYTGGQPTYFLIPCP